ncbi:hypothetical protein GCM10011349_23510 [Novosphingobium indicum]|uniref:Uncharacterized protein n=1 Tax=Novosphingobium indicum TaxID=462949 RepID=A0ABQ2JMB1_9SPHN|nr:hypothetical protein [Novosphingobium indicum]GGN51188.1 hypothetical protein GCM10011349_23510 [Novosphingobium indicum]
MPRMTQQDLQDCRIDLYEQCQSLAALLEVNLADFAEKHRYVSPREIAAMRRSACYIPISSITRLVYLRCRLQDQVNAAYFRQLQDTWYPEEAQGELFPFDDEDDDCPF